MTIAVRAARPDDVRSIVLAHNESLPRRAYSRHNLEVFESAAREHASRLDGYLVAEDDGDVVGYAHVSPPGDIGALVELCVRPSRRHRGAGRALADAMAEVVAAFGPTRVRAFNLSDDERSIAFAARYGEVARADLPGQYELLVTSDLAPLWRASVESASTVSVRRLSPSDLDDARVVHEVYELHLTSESEPFLWPGMTGELDEFVTEQRFRVLHEGFVVVTYDGDAAVGLSTCSRAEFVPRLYNELTYVSPPARGRGIAAAMKASIALAALGAGIEAIGADNQPENVGMHAVNDKLGYRLWPSVTFSTDVG